MKIPAGLKHKPVVMAEGYNRIDGRYAPNSDAKGLSLGLAQWNDRGRVDISAKVWRHTGEKWSRQSEEMPLHRVLDLALLICQARLYFAELYHKGDDAYPKFPLIEKIGLQGGAMDVEICLDNEHIAGDKELFGQCLSEDDEIIGERLNALASILKQLGY
jgi:hypothetical protein